MDVDIAKDVMRLALTEHGKKMVEMLARGCRYTKNDKNLGKQFEREQVWNCF